jgi:hypothetical protein
MKSTTLPRILAQGPQITSIDTKFLPKEFRKLDGKIAITTIFPNPSHRLDGQNITWLQQAQGS